MFRMAMLLFSAGLSFGADVIVVNGKVITVDPAKPYAEAFAVTNGRFAAVGTNAEIRRLATPATKIVDLQGMTVTPGFNDVHLHPVGVYDESSPYYTPWLGPEKVHNMDELIAALKTKADRTPAGADGERHRATRTPSSAAIRIATIWTRPPPTHPIIDQPLLGPHHRGQQYILQASGITKETKDPPGGSFDRDPDGTPNGVIREAARRLLSALHSQAGEPRVPFDDEVQGYLRCFR